MSRRVIVVTGTSSGFGAMTARVLAKAGHIVYARMRATEGRNAPQVADTAAFAKNNGVDLRSVELNVANDASVELSRWGIETSIVVPGAFTRCLQRSSAIQWRRQWLCKWKPRWFRRRAIQCVPLPAPPPEQRLI